jgi:dTMP kinase
MANRRTKALRSPAPRFPSGPPPGADALELPGKLVVIEGPDGSGRSTQVTLLKEWLECAGFAVETMGLRRSDLLSRNIDVALAHNVVTRLTLALMYATDFYDQLERRLLPAMRAGFIVLADRYYFSLMARAAVRGIDRAFIEGIYEHAIRPDLVFRLRVSPEVAFDREFRKSQVISYWESGRDMNLADNLYDSFVEYQRLMRREFDRLAKKNQFIDVEAEAPIRDLNTVLRKQIAGMLAIKDTSYQPSAALAQYWR